MTKRKVKLNDIEDVKKFVGATSKCAADTTVKSGRYVVDAKSIMGMFSLNLAEPITLEIDADEADCQTMLAEIAEFIVVE